MTRHRVIVKINRIKTYFGVHIRNWVVFMGKSWKMILPLTSWIIFENQCHDLGAKFWGSWHLQWSKYAVSHEESDFQLENKQIQRPEAKQIGKTTVEKFMIWFDNSFFEKFWEVGARFGGGLRGGFLGGFRKIWGGFGMEEPQTKKAPRKTRSKTTVFLIVSYLFYV